MRSNKCNLVGAHMQDKVAFLPAVLGIRPLCRDKDQTRRDGLEGTLPGAGAPMAGMVGAPAACAAGGPAGAPLSEPTAAAPPTAAGAPGQGAAL